MGDTTNIHQVKKGQKRTAIIIGGIIVIVLASIYFLTAQTDKPEIKEKNNKKENYISPWDQLDTQSVVLERTQKQLRDTEKKTEDLQQKVASMLNGKKEENRDLEANAEKLAKRVTELEKKLQTISDNRNQALSTKTQGFMQGEYQGNLFPAANQTITQEGYGSDAGQGMIREDKLSLSPNENEIAHRSFIKNPDTYVPSGTFAKAVIIGGADAAASVMAQANPKVMLLRIVENGTLPNHKKSHLKDCMAVGRVTGDISSERGSITIERLSCVFPNNEIVDQKVEAIVFGPDGKVDVLGNVREGGQQYVGRAFAAGTLSGLSEGLSQTYTVNSLSPQGSVQTTNPSKIFQFGAAKGAGKAMDKLADYQMRKAEQFHPVIQLSAGTVVDIMFQMGFFLDGKTHEEPDKKTVGSYATEVPSDTPRLFPTPTANQDLQALPLSSKAVERIEKYNKELGFRVSSQKEERA